MVGLSCKMKCVVSRHRAMKSTFLQLQSQIQISLLQAEDVFASLSVPLMRLVGLKNAQMAEEGRFTTILMKANSLDHARRGAGVVAQHLTRSPSAGDGFHHLGERYATEANRAGKELKEKQQVQIIQLVHLLRQIETQVNCHHGDIRRTLADHRSSLHKSFHTAVSYIAAIHHSGQNQETSQLLILKVFQIMLRQMDAALMAVESGVEDLMEQLAQQMCNPMVEYVKGLKTEMASGTFARLLTILEGMELEIRGGKMEVEEERVKVSVAAGKRKLEAQTRLTEIEERERRMKQQLRSPSETKKSYTTATVRPRQARRLC